MDLMEENSYNQSGIIRKIETWLNGQDRYGGGYYVVIRT